MSKTADFNTFTIQTSYMYMYFIYIYGLWLLSRGGSQLMSALPARTPYDVNNRRGGQLSCCLHLFVPSTGNSQNTPYAQYHTPIFIQRVGVPWDLPSLTQISPPQTFRLYHILYISFPPQWHQVLPSTCIYLS